MIYVTLAHHFVDRRPGRSLLADEWTLASVFVIISRVERSSLAVVTSAAALAAVHQKYVTNFQLITGKQVAHWLCTRCT
jgi:hypothetical protein